MDNGSTLSLPEIEDRIAILRDNIRQLHRAGRGRLGRRERSAGGGPHRRAGRRVAEVDCPARRDAGEAAAPSAGREEGQEESQKGEGRGEEGAGGKVSRRRPRRRLRRRRLRRRRPRPLPGQSARRPRKKSRQKPAKKKPQRRKPRSGGSAPRVPGALRHEMPLRRTGTGSAPHHCAALLLPRATAIHRLVSSLAFASATSTCPCSAAGAATSSRANRCCARAMSSRDVTVPVRHRRLLARQIFQFGRDLGDVVGPQRSAQSPECAPRAQARAGRPSRRQQAAESVSCRARLTRLSRGATSFPEPRHVERMQRVAHQAEAAARDVARVPFGAFRRSRRARPETPARRPRAARRCRCASCPRPAASPRGSRMRRPTAGRPRASRRVFACPSCPPAPERAGALRRCGSVKLSGKESIDFDPIICIYSLTSSAEGRCHEAS